ncbi:MAG: 2-succinylbenzoate--CoA ligase [Cyanobacteria bacterium P01_D01_bin.123]
MAELDIEAIWQLRAEASWWFGADSRDFARYVTQARSELANEWSDPDPPRILLCDRDPARFLARFLAACLARYPVFLANPDWGEWEWVQVRALARPHLVWGGNNCLCPADPAADASPEDSGLILIPTGGSSGDIKFASHTWQTLMASVAGFRQHFALEQVDSFCTLPLYHVSGLMQFLRSLVSGGRLVLTTSRQMLHGEWLDFDPQGWYLSLVPTQLQRALPDRDLIQWLARFETLLVGGGPTWPTLLEAARRHRLRLAPTYGTTETASQVATLKPDEFLVGRTGCGRSLPHAKISIATPTSTSPTSAGVGAIAIQSPALALGYYPDRFHSAWQPDDLGYLDADGYLHVVGRASDKIVTGGENVFPAEVEAVLQATGLVADVAVIGVNDPNWGEAIAALVVPNSGITTTQIEAAIVGQLAAYKRPKYWLESSSLPRNHRGKLERDRLTAIWRQWRTLQH